VRARVPGLDDDAAPQRRRVKGGGRPKHAVTLGQHDYTITKMTQRGKGIGTIAALLGCSYSLVAQRLRVLGEAVQT